MSQFYGALSALGQSKEEIAVYIAVQQALAREMGLRKSSVLSAPPATVGSLFAVSGRYVYLVGGGDNRVYVIEFPVERSRGSASHVELIARTMANGTRLEYQLCDSDLRGRRADLLTRMHPNEYPKSLVSALSKVLELPSLEKREGLQVHSVFNARKPLQDGCGPKCIIGAGASKGCAFISRLDFWDGCRFNDPQALYMFAADLRPRQAYARLGAPPQWKESILSWLRYSTVSLLNERRVRELLTERLNVAKEWSK